MIPSSRPKLSDLHTLSQSKLFEIDTLQSSTYLYSPYVAILPPAPRHRTVYIIVTVPLPMADLVGLITSLSELESLSGRGNQAYIPSPGEIHLL